MQALLNLFAGMLSAVAALAFAQFGVSLHGKHEARSHPIEIRRTVQPKPAVRCSTSGPAPTVRVDRRA